jgi:hypothetical protein
MYIIDSKTEAQEATVCTTYHKEYFNPYPANVECMVS